MTCVVAWRADENHNDPKTFPIGNDRSYWSTAVTDTLSVCAEYGRETTCTNGPRGSFETRGIQLALLCHKF
jgi:hypothetical protein